MHEFGYPWFPLWDPAGATRFLHEALKLLQSGGLPVVGLGPKAPQPHRIPFLGRSIPVPIGAGYLASRAGVRLMPVTATWAGLSPHINLTLHDPIPEPARGTLSQTDWEVEVVRAAIAWFGDYLRAHPEDLRPVNLRHLLQHLRQHPREPSKADFDRLAESFAE
jgi:hypothetical protein